MTEPAFRARCPVEVRFRDCDPMGHVNNAVYLTYLELARFAYWKAADIERLAGEVSYIIARVEIDFRSPAVTGDMLDVAIAVTGFGRTSFSMAYEIRNQDGRLVATAKSVQAAYDYAAGKTVPLPDVIKQRIAEFEGRSLSCGSGIDESRAPSPESRIPEVPVQVLIFGKDSWPYTSEAREAFARRGYAVEYFNVKKNAADLQRMLGYSRGRRDVPVIVEDEKVTIGYGGSWGV